MTEEKKEPTCNKDHPNDPHYPDRHFGYYTENCEWIWDIGMIAKVSEGVSRALKCASDF